ncbi:putative zinc protease [uncultured Comamonas sp.]|nr:putative zinc protease [uncultured Comamonas sp.]
MPPSQVQQFTLDNGLQVLVLPDRRAPTAVQMLWVRTGAMDEVDGRSGLAHMLEHMLFKGSKALPPGAFSRRVAALGGQENAFTSRDYTGYYQQVPASRLPEVMQLEAERFAHNQWPDEEFAKELEVVKEERRMRTEDSPRAMLMEQLYATMFSAAPYRRPVVGWMSDLHSMHPDDARSFYRDWYAPNNAALVVAGDVDPQQVKAWAQQYYGPMAARALPERKPRTEPAQLGIKRISVKQPAEQAYVALAWKVPALRQVTNMDAQDKDALALLVLSAVLDGYDGARLERHLVQTRLADSAGSGADVFGRGPAVFLLTGAPAKGQTSAALEAGLRAEIERIAREGVDAAELQRVKTQWQASQVYARDSVMGQAQNLGHNWVVGLPVDADEQLLQQVQGIASADVQSVARRYFGDDNLTVATLVPQPRAQAANTSAQPEKEEK